MVEDSFEPSKRDMLNEENTFRNDARIIREKRDKALFHEEMANELNKALIGPKMN